MKKDTSDTLKYKARVYTDKAIIPKIEEDLRTMVYVLIGDKKLEITHNREGFDVYPSCKDSSKQWCPAKKKKYQARLTDHALVFFGDSYIELYCQIITSIAGRQVYTPFSSIPKPSSSDDCDGPDKVDTSNKSVSLRRYVVSTYIEPDIGTTGGYSEEYVIEAMNEAEAQKIHEKVYNKTGYYSSVVRMEVSNTTPLGLWRPGD